VHALCPLAIRGTLLLATAGDDGTVQLWHPGTGQQRRGLPDQGGPVRDLCAITLHGRLLLVSVGDNAVRLWDPDLNDRRPGGTGRSAEVTALGAVLHGNKELVASGRSDGSVQLHTAATGHQIRVLTGHNGPITGLTAMFRFGQVMLASASTDNTIGVWTLDAALQRPRRDHRPGWSTTICTVFLHRQLVLACAGDHGTVRLWDPYTGRQRRRVGLRRFRPTRHRHTSPVSALCSIRSRAGTRVASGGHDGTIRIWDLDTGRQLTVFGGHGGPVHALCTLTLRGQQLLASASDDKIIRIWDIQTGRQLAAMHGHTGQITSLCSIQANRRTLLASTAHDGTSRIWEPTTGSLELTIPVHHDANACIAAADRLIIGLTAGTLAISLNI
jgi:WD40 repeat protein